VETALRVDVESRGGLCLKVVFPGVRGAPDRLVLLPDVAPFMVELKKPGKGLKEHQRRLHNRLRVLNMPVVGFDGQKII
jgi:hypothetical protein